MGGYHYNPRLCWWHLQAIILIANKYYLFRHIRVTWTFMDPYGPWPIYAIWTYFSQYSLCFSSLISSQKTLSLPVKLSRSLSNCWDPIQSKINPLLLLQLHSNHPPRLWHYANQNPKLRAPPEPSDASSLLSENSKWPLRTPITFLSLSVFIILF